MYHPLKKRRRTPTLREKLEDSHRAQSFYALACDKAVPVPALLQEMRDKAARRASAKTAPAKPKGPSEHQEQCAVIAWWWRVHTRYRLPHFALFAVPNGGARDAITGSRLKSEGVRRGALDLILAKPSQHYHGLFIEMKVGSNKLTDDQELFKNYLIEVGYKASGHWSAESAIAEIVGYLGSTTA